VNVENISLSRTTVASDLTASDFIWCPVIEDLLYTYTTHTYTHTQLLFHSRLHVHTWLLTMQCIMVAFQIVVLPRALYWSQTLSMSVFLTFNYFVLYKLLYNRLWFRIVPILS